ncbi:MAG: hypothetical protein AAF850_03315 [Pseudomonadota bacterium]
MADAIDMNTDTGDGAFSASQEGRVGGGRIEGGYDAVVVGATIDGYVAAAYLAKSGLRTVLLEAGAEQPERRAFAPGFYADDGECLLRDLDTEAVNALNLYRHGLCYVQRRFGAMYYFSDQSSLAMNGDLFCAYETVADFDEAEADPFQRFLEQLLETGRELRPFFHGEPTGKLSAKTLKLIDFYGSSSIDQLLNRGFKNDRLKDLLRTEASIHSGLRPSDPHSFLSLIRRWSGEAAGLQGGCAFASGGFAGLYSALRRGAQALGVDIRAGGAIGSMLVEWDGAAGVQMADGGQIRAPIVINALGAARAFIDQLGPEHIDIEFQKSITTPEPRFTFAKVHIALSGAAKDDLTKKNLSRRLVYCPDAREVRVAYRMARDGEVGPALMAELTFPSIFEEGWAPENSHLAQAWIGPVPYRTDDMERTRKEVGRAALSTFEFIAPGVTDRVTAIDVQLTDDRANILGLPSTALSGYDAVLAQAQRARVARTASNVRGVFYCGPEAQISPGVNGAAGRRAGQAAIAYRRSLGAAA